MVANAKEYNERDSEIHADAEKIRRHVQTFMTQHNPAYEDSSHQPFPTQIPKSREKEDPEDGLEEEHAEGIEEEKEIALGTNGGRKSRRSGAQSAVKAELVAQADTSTSSNGTATAGQAKRRLTLNGPKDVAAPPVAKSPTPKPSAPATVGPSFEGKTFQEVQEIIMEDLLSFTNDE